MSDVVPRLYAAAVDELKNGHFVVSVRRLGTDDRHVYGDYGTDEEALCVKSQMQKRLDAVGLLEEVGDEVARAHAEADVFCRSRSRFERTLR